MKNSVSPSSSQVLAKSGYKQSTKPAISQAWKLLFKREPMLHKPEESLYFDKEALKPEVEYRSDELGIYKNLRGDTLENNAIF